MIRLFIVIVLGFASTSWAYKTASPDGYAKEYKFEFKFKDQTKIITRTAASYEDAFEVASVDCFNYFTGTNGQQKVNEDLGMDVIDTCANPR